jgi:DNA-binding MarR family transcriptional regulator
VLTPDGNGFTDLVIEVFRLNGLLLSAGDRLSAPAGLTSARWQVLGVVDPEPVPVADIARTMGLARQSVQEIADALVRDGLATWSENPKHKRAKCLGLTERGVDALYDVEQAHAVWANEAAAALDPERVRAAVALLRDARAQLEKQP